MKIRKPNQNSDTQSRSRYIVLTRYEAETSGDLKTNDTPASTKNFPSTFIPMKELDELGA